MSTHTSIRMSTLRSMGPCVRSSILTSVRMSTYMSIRRHRGQHRGLHQGQHIKQHHKHCIRHMTIRMSIRMPIHASIHMSIHTRLYTCARASCVYRSFWQVYRTQTPVTHACVLEHTPMLGRDYGCASPHSCTGLCLHACLYTGTWSSHQDVSTSLEETYGAAS